MIGRSVLVPVLETYSAISGKSSDGINQALIFEFDGHLSNFLSFKSHTLLHTRFWLKSEFSHTPWSLRNTSGCGNYCSEQFIWLPLNLFLRVRMIG